MKVYYQDVAIQIELSGCKLGNLLTPQADRQEIWRVVILLPRTSYFNFKSPFHDDSAVSGLVHINSHSSVYCSEMEKFLLWPEWSHIVIEKRKKKKERKDKNTTDKSVAQASSQSALMFTWMIDCPMSQISLAYADRLKDYGS